MASGRKTASVGRLAGISPAGSSPGSLRRLSSGRPGHRVKLAYWQASTTQLPGHAVIELVIVNGPRSSPGSDEPSTMIE